MYEYHAVVTNVVDGDTIDVILDLGFKITVSQRLRLARIDTPERGQSGYAEAREFVQALVQNRDVEIRTHKVSKWGYYLADVSIDGNDVASTLLAAGLAKEYNGGKK